jgi:hypothetical protein
MNKHLVTFPNGTTQTRNSKTRRYTHAVVTETTAASIEVFIARTQKDAETFASWTDQPERSASLVAKCEQEIANAPSTLGEMGVLSWHTGAANAEKGRKGWAKRFAGRTFIVALDETGSADLRPSEPKAPEAPATDATVEQKVAYVVAALDGVATPETLDALGFSKTARSYGWYWNSDKNGKPNAGKAAATALGLRASLRKVDGVRCLVLSAA